MKINNLLLIGAFFFILCCFPFIELQANELKPTDTIEYFDDGSYYEITLQEDLNIFRSSTKNGSKTVTYKSANGTTLWSVTVHGFNYLPCINMENHFSIVIKKWSFSISHCYG